MAKFFSGILNITSNMESNICDICKKQIEEKDEDIFECDLCDKTIHIQCGSIKKSEIKARKGSKCLKIYCPKCLEENENVLPTKVNEINRMVYKLDMNFQERKTIEQNNSQMINEMMKMLKNVLEKVENLGDRI